MIDKRRTTILIGTMFLGLAVVLWARPAAEEPFANAEAARLRTVRVAPVERIEAGREARLPGVTRAARRAALAFTIPARVAVRPVEVGDRVRAGQLLARLDGEEYLLAERSSRAALAELEVRLAQARRDEARVASLAAARAATAEELEQARAAAGATQAAHDAARARLDNAARLARESELRAPFAGTVTAVHSSRASGRRRARRRSSSPGAAPSRSGSKCPSRSRPAS